MSTTIFPSFGQWLVKAPQPVCPVNGKPAAPPSGKTPLYRRANRLVISNDESWLTSSGHTHSVYREFSHEKPLFDKKSTIYDSASMPGIYP